MIQWIFTRQKNTWITQFARVFLLFGILMFALPQQAEAAIFTLNPASKNVPVGEKFTVELHIDTEGQEPLAADAEILYDSTALELVEIILPEAGKGFFKEVYKTIKPNKVYIGAAVGPGGAAKSGKGLIASLVFKGIKSNSNVVSFQCVENKTTDSNITIKRDKTVSDVISCAALTNATYAVGSATSTTPTTGAGTPTSAVTPSTAQSPMPTLSVTPATTTTLTPSISPTLILTPGISIMPTAISTITPNPNELPNTGAVETTIIAITVGVVLTIISLSLKAIL